MGHDTPPPNGPKTGTRAHARAFRCPAGLRAVALFFVALVLQGCATGSWYLQSVSGHVRLMGARRDIAAALNDPALAPEMRTRLAQVPRLVEFATRELGLPDNGSYGSFVLLDRSYVTWNVFAAPRLALEPRRWCYPMVGCLVYRGYFSEAAARLAATRLDAAGEDVYVGGVTAYSTLGWFRDPVTSPMLRSDRLDLAILLFHELAHQEIWLRGDTELNEAFAETVARIGVERLVASENAKLPAAYVDRVAEADRFFALVLEHRRALQALYDAPLPAALKLERKQQVLNLLRQEYHAGKRNPGAPARFDAWVDSGLNNAKLAAVSSYRELVPGLMAIYARNCRDLKTFFDQIRQLQSCPLQERHDWVRSGGSEPSCWMAKQGEHKFE